MPIDEKDLWPPCLTGNKMELLSLFRKVSMRGGKVMYHRGGVAKHGQVSLIEDNLIWKMPKFWDENSSLCHHEG